MRKILEELDALSPDERGRVFEHRVVPWILREAQVYRNQLAAVWHWSNYPQRHLWGPDRGIDLVAKDRADRLWAVQAKAHAIENVVTWRHISTFVGAAAAQPQVHCLVLITTAAAVGRAAEEQIVRCGKPSIVIVRDQLLELGLPNETSLADLDSTRSVVQHFGPQEHQKEAIAACVRGFSQTNRGQVIHACGTGKTLTTLWTSEALGCKRTIVFCPSLALVDQSLREWQTQASAPFTAIVVCSDQSVGRADNRAGEGTSLQLALPPTTDAGRLREMLRAQMDKVVVFATYQSSAVIAEALRGADFRFDLLVADEAHRTTGLAAGPFHLPLDDAQIGTERRLFVTATPRIYRQRQAPDVNGDSLSVISMDDVSQFGPRFHCLSFREAIARDLLSDYRVVIFGVTPGEVAQMISQRAFVTHDGEEVVDAVELATHVALARAMREFEMRRALSFHSRVKGAAVFADRFARVVDWLPASERPDATVWAGTLSGEDSVQRRRQVLRRLQEGTDGEYGLVTNARCLGEGVDVPAIDGVVFVDPKSSEIDIVQAVGRAIRKSHDKSGLSTVILPIVVADDKSDATTDLEGSKYSHIWRVVDALRSHDELLGEELDAIRRSMAGESSVERVALPKKIVLRLPERVSAAFAQALTVRLVERTTSGWERGFAELVAYQGRNGGAIPGTMHTTTAGYPLGPWVNTQRMDYFDGILADGRRMRLEAIGFVWEALDARWEEGFSQLVAYQATHGDTNVLDKGEHQGYPLGNWVRVQRRRYRAGRMPPERAARLEAIGFSWRRNTTRWDSNHRLLEAVKHGEVKPSSDEKRKLASWLHRERTAWGLGRLSSERVALLQAVGVEPLASREGPWERMYSRLVAQLRGGRIDASVAVGEVDAHVHTWLTRQCARYRIGNLREDRVASLERIGVDWNSPTADWDEGLRHLQIYVSREMDADVPTSHVEAGFKLGQWLAGQRLLYRRGVLKPERIALLQRVGCELDPTLRRWQTAYSHLVAFAERNGHTLVPRSHLEADSFPLGQWVYEQRKAFALGACSADRIDLLEKLPDWRWRWSARKYVRRQKGS